MPTAAVQCRWTHAAGGDCDARCDARWVWQRDHHSLLPGSPHAVTGGTRGAEQSGAAAEATRMAELLASAPLRAVLLALGAEAPRLSSSPSFARAPRYRLGKARWHHAVRVGSSCAGRPRCRSPLRPRSDPRSERSARPGSGRAAPSPRAASPGLLEGHVQQPGHPLLGRLAAPVVPGGGRHLSMLRQLLDRGDVRPGIQRVTDEAAPQGRAG